MPLRGHGDNMLDEVPPAGRCKKKWKECARGEKPPTVHTPRADGLCQWCKKEIVRADLIEFEDLLGGRAAQIWVRKILVTEWP